MSISWDSPEPSGASGAPSETAANLVTPKPAIKSISWDSPEPSGASGAPAETAANLVTPKPAHHEHQLGQPPLKHKNASIMSISWDSPEPSGASGAPAETAANLVTPKPAHHEHQLGQPPNLTQHKSASIMSISCGAFRSIRSTSRDCCKTFSPRSPSITSISMDSPQTL